MIELEKEYLALVDIYDQSNDQYEVEAWPWYFFFTKKGLLVFLRNGAPDKNNELHAASSFVKHIENLCPNEVDALKGYSELNISRQREASHDMITFKIAGIIALVYAFWKLVIKNESFQLYSKTIEFVSDLLPTVVYEHLMIIIQLMLLPIIFTIPGFIISLIARGIYLQKAIELDQTLEKAILQIKANKIFERTTGTQFESKSRGQPA